MRANIVEMIRGLSARAIDQVIRDKIKNKLDTAFGSDDINSASDSIEEINSEIETTEEEIFGYNIIKAICAEKITPDRVFMRDSKSYCAILLDDNNRKPICRLRFNSKKKKNIGLFSQKKESIYEIDKIEDIYSFSKEIRKAIDDYE